MEELACVPDRICPVALSLKRLPVASAKGTAGLVVAELFHRIAYIYRQHMHFVYSGKGTCK